MHIPPIQLFDRIKTGTVIAGLKYYGQILFFILKMKISSSKNHSSDKSIKNLDSPSIIDNFHLLYESNHKQTYDNTYWMGIKSMKCPLDLWIYQEILFKTRPDIIIETGTFQGGTTLFLANVCDIMDNGEIITIDISSPNKKPEHKRIHYIQGDTISKKTITKIQQLIDKLNNNSDTKIMVILDDEHSENHVFQEMEIYGKFVTPGNYLIVEDTSMGGHPVWSELKSGPMESVERYVKIHNDFEIDADQEKFLLTFNPKGYLKKINS
jgi:cephalosporin hydroxylase